MQKPSKTNQELHEEITALKQRIRKLEQFESEHKRVEEALRESEANYRRLFDSSPSVIYQVDFRTGKFLKANDIVCEYLGCSQDEITTMSPYDLLTDESKIVFEERLRKIFLGETVTENPEYEVIDKNGKRWWLQLSSKFIYDSDGLAGADVVGHDITNRKRIEEALQESEERFRFLAENMGDVVWTTDLAFKTTYISPSVERILGFTVEERKQQPPEEMMTTDSVHRAISVLAKELEKDGQPGIDPNRTVTVEIEYYHKDGTVIWMENSMKAMRNQAGEIIGIYGVSRNITERLKAEQNLKAKNEELHAAYEQLAANGLELEQKYRELEESQLALQGSEQRYRLIAENASDTIWMMGFDGAFTYHSPAVQPLRGFTPEEANSIPLMQTLTYDSLALVQRVLDEENRKPLAERWGNRLLELEMYRKDGSTVWTEASIKALRDEAGSIIGFQGSTRDITLRRQAVEALQESEERYRGIIENMLDGYYRTDEEGNLTMMSPSGVYLLGYDSFRELRGKNLARDIYLHPEDRSMFLAKIQAEGHVRNYDVLIKRKDGSTILVSTTSRFYYSKDGAILGVEGFFRDISERRRAEKERKRRDDLEKSILASVPHALFGVEYRHIFFANEAMEKVFGWRPEELIGKSTRVLFRNDKEWEEYGHVLYSLMEAQPVVSFEPDKPFVRKDGQEIYCRNSVSRIGELLSEGNKIVATFEDITQRKRLDEALKESEERYRNIFNNAIEGIFQTTPEGRYRTINQAFSGMFGYESPEEMINAVNDIGNQLYADPGDRKRLIGLLSQAEGMVRNFEVQLIRKDGTPFWVSINARMVRDRKGEAPFIEGICMDITQRKEVEKALKESQQSLSEIIDFLPDATFVIDRGGRVTAWNHAIETMTGIKAADMIGKGDFAYALPFYGERRPILIDIVLSSEHKSLENHYDAVQRRGGVLSGEVYVPHAYNGKGAYLWGNASRLYSAQGDVVGAIQSIRDVTDRRDAEERRRDLEMRLQRSEKMEALGTLAGGVAHDLNNVLGIVVGYAEMVLDALEEEHPIRSDIIQIMQSGQRASAIVQDLLTLARRGVQTRKVINLNDTIRDCQKTPEFENILSFNPLVGMHLDLEMDLLNIIGSPVHLGKTILNLISNAVEAMPAGGSLVITTNNQYLDLPIQGYDNVREGDYVVLSVADTGEGISEKDVKRIFEPFYTKKIMGKSGTGLGLAVVWGTVKDHNGYINVVSELGKGTVFTLYFPVTRDEVAKESTSLSISDYLGRGESILVVDDIRGQRDLATRMLTRLNYQVASVSSGEQAVEYIKTNNVDLVVLDMIMDPGMDGLDTFTQVIKIQPGQKVLIVSGFSETERVKKAQELGAGAYLKKPYVLERLGLAVRKELDRG